MYIMFYAFIYDSRCISICIYIRIYIHINVYIYIYIYICIYALILRCFKNTYIVYTHIYIYIYPMLRWHKAQDPSVDIAIQMLTWHTIRNPSVYMAKKRRNDPSVDITQNSKSKC